MFCNNALWKITTVFEILHNFNATFHLALSSIGLNVINYAVNFAAILSAICNLGSAQEIKCKLIFQVENKMWPKSVKKVYNGK